MYTYYLCIPPEIYNNEKWDLQRFSMFGLLSCGYLLQFAAIENNIILYICNALLNFWYMLFSAMHFSTFHICCFNVKIIRFYAVSCQFLHKIWAKQWTALGSRIQRYWILISKNWNTVRFSFTLVFEMIKLYPFPFCLVIIFISMEVSFKMMWEIYTCHLPNFKATIKYNLHKSYTTVDLVN